MDRNLTFRLSVILFVVGVSLVLLYPTFRYFSKYRKLTQEQVMALSEGERREMRSVLEKSMKLGLDLQGGMHVVLELDRGSVREADARDAQDRVMEILSTRVDQFGVTEPTLSRQGTDRIMVQLPGVEDPERAKGLLGDVAQLEFRFVRDPQDIVKAVQAIDAVLASEAATDTTHTAATPGDTTQAATKTPGSAAATDTAAAKAADSLQLPELPSVKAAAEKPGNSFSSLFVTLQFGALYVPDDGFRVQRVRELLADSRVRAAIASAVPRAEFLWSSESDLHTQDGVPVRLLYLVGTEKELTGEFLQDARTGPDPDRPGSMLINFRLDRRGARTFSRLTADHVGKQLAIILDSVVKSAPSIRNRIPNGEGQISGSFTDQQARDLAIVLRAGALPVTLTIVEERTVGPTLGSDSLRRGLMAGGVGLGLSISFLVVYYQLSGLVAALALAVNLLITLAAMATLRAALSLPGIAGLVLAVAMAVDANVLIFERIREEMRKSKTVAASIEAGYKGALSAIVDSNLTTLFAGIVLLYFGTGPVKGFAVTLCIGITTSMFTALFVTRFVFDLFTRRRRLEKLSI